MLRSSQEGLGGLSGEKLFYILQILSSDIVQKLYRPTCAPLEIKWWCNTTHKLIGPGSCTDATASCLPKVSGQHPPGYQDGTSWKRRDLQIYSISEHVCHFFSREAIGGSCHWHLCSVTNAGPMPRSWSICHICLEHRWRKDLLTVQNQQTFLISHHRCMFSLALQVCRADRVSTSRILRSDFISFDLEEFWMRLRLLPSPGQVMCLGGQEFGGIPKSPLDWC